MKVTTGPQQGFTLIEVLIVTVLLFFLSMGLFSSVRETVKTKEDIDQLSEVLQGARAAFSLFDRDMKSAFLVLPEDLGWNPKRPATLPASQPWAPPPRPIPVTIFQGSGQEVFFTARTHQRLFVDAPENEQQFVTYQLHEGELVRAESLRAISLKDREDPSSFHQFVLLTQIKSFKLSYYSRKQDQWLDTWDTERAETKDILPDAVKIELEYLPEVSKQNIRRKLEPIQIATVIRPSEALYKTPLATNASGNPQNPGAPGVPQNPDAADGTTTGGGR